MAIEYSWNIIEIECLPILGIMPNYIASVHWTLIGSDENETGSVYGSVNFNLQEDQIEYFNFHDLTLVQVLDWVFDKLGTEKIKMYEDAIVKQIADKKKAL